MKKNLMALTLHLSLCFSRLNLFLRNVLTQSKNFFSALLHAEEIEPHFQYSLLSASTFMEIYYFYFQLSWMLTEQFYILSQQNSWTLVSSEAYRYKLVIKMSAEEITFINDCLRDIKFIISSRAIAVEISTASM